MSKTKRATDPKREKLRTTSKPADRILRPVAIEQRYGVSGPTRWRWEKSGRLPPRDVFLNGKPWGWRESSLVAAESGRS
jgi:predicted DNA-binding transcriptional regulator AlpA